MRAISDPDDDSNTTDSVEVFYCDRPCQSLEVNPPQPNSWNHWYWERNAHKRQWSH